MVNLQYLCFIFPSPTVPLPSDTYPFYSTRLLPSHAYPFYSTRLLPSHALLRCFTLQDEDEPDSPANGRREEVPPQVIAQFETQVRRRCIERPSPVVLNSSLLLEAVDRSWHLPRSIKRYHFYFAHFLITLRAPANSFRFINSSCPI